MPMVLNRISMDYTIKAGLKKRVDSYEKRASRMRVEAGGAKSQRHKIKLLSAAQTLDEIVRDLMMLLAHG